MAQNGPHGNQGSDDGHRAPPTTVTFALKTAAPYGNGGGSGSSAGNMETMDVDAGGMGKNLIIPDLNMEEDADAEAEVEVPAADADADKGKSAVPVAEFRELGANIIIERERRHRMKGLFETLQGLMPHVPQKTDRVTLVGEAINYIRALEEKAAMLAKQKQMHDLARLAAARGEASSSSAFSLAAMPQTAQGMAALFSPDVPRGWGAVSVPPVAAPAVPPASPASFKTWTGPNVVLTVVNDHAYISVTAPRRANTLSMLVSVLESHGIRVVTAQISADDVRTLYMLHTHVTGIEGETRSSEQVYKTAVAEIMFRLNYYSNK